MRPESISHTSLVLSQVRPCSMEELFRDFFSKKEAARRKKRPKGTNLVEDHFVRLWVTSVQNVESPSRYCFPRPELLSQISNCPRLSRCLVETDSIHRPKNTPLPDIKPAPRFLAWVQISLNHVTMESGHFFNIHKNIINPSTPNPTFYIKSTLNSKYWD